MSDERTHDWGFLDSLHGANLRAEKDIPSTWHGMVYYCTVDKAGEQDGGRRLGNNVEIRIYKAKANPSYTVVPISMNVHCPINMAAGRCTSEQQQVWNHCMLTARAPAPHVAATALATSAQSISSPSRIILSKMPAK